MDFQLQQMSIPEYARLSTQLGGTIVERDGIYWRRVRPFFYRPLHSVEPIEAESFAPPSHWFGGYQHAVADARQANSTLNFIMLDSLRDYGLSSLSHRRRHLITQAARRFQVRQIESLSELKEQGYRAYCSFFERTRYAYRSDRVERSRFGQWADHLFRQPKVLLLGGYGASGLTAISASYWIKDTLNYMTFYAETESLRLNIGEAMFHELRLTAARHPGIREIMIRPYKGGESMDQYYLLRGGKVVRKPARLALHPVGHAVLRKFRPAEYSLLMGSAGAGTPPPFAAPVPESRSPSPLYPGIEIAVAPAERGVR